MAISSHLQVLYQNLNNLQNHIILYKLTTMNFRWTSKEKKAHILLNEEKLDSSPSKSLLFFSKQSTLTQVEPCSKTFFSPPIFLLNINSFTVFGITREVSNYLNISHDNLIVNKQNIRRWSMSSPPYTYNTN